MEKVMIIANKSLVCQDPTTIDPMGGFWSENPLDFYTPLLLLQLFVISLFSLIMDACLRPLGQSTIVAQIVGGMLFGPSVFGHKEFIGTKLFPLRGIMVLETTATFGLMFFLFLIAVQMDMSTMIKPDKRAIYMAISVMFISLGFTVTLAIILIKYVPMDSTLSESLPFLAVAQCLTPFPNVACLLTELKILNTDLGRLAMSTTMFSDIIGISIVATCFAVLTSVTTIGGSGLRSSLLTSLWAVLSSMAVVGVIILIVRPVIAITISKLPRRKPVGELYIQSMFIVVLVFGFASEVVGQHYPLGPMILGLVVPAGPPLGSAMSKKLDYPINKVLYPAYLTTSGLKTNIFAINFEASWVFALVILASFVVKMVAVLLPGYFSSLAFRDSFVLGLILNARGVAELLLYNLLLDINVLTNELFAIAVLSVIVITAIITPVVSFLYDPSKQHIPTKRRSIQILNQDTELSILVCIHDLENVTSLVNVLEASHASEESFVHAVVVILVQLIGRTNNVLIEHSTLSERIPNTNINTEQIIGALHQYELCNENRVTLRTFSSISHYETMHHDICKVAREQKSCVVILPFHKQFEIDGSVGASNRALQDVNLKVLESAPCAVGILVDRGILNGSTSILVTQTIFHVAVVYIGGPDDLESLAYANRMAKKENVTVTIARFLLFGSDNARQRKFDNDRIEDVRRAHSGSPRLTYVEELVRDGDGLATSMRSLLHDYDLIIVGKNHPDSQMFTGLEACNDNQELGVIGDMLASPNFGTRASILILQQQNALNRSLVIPVVNEPETPMRQVNVRPIATTQQSVTRPSEVASIMMSDSTPTGRDANALNRSLVIPVVNELETPMRQVNVRPITTTQQSVTRPSEVASMMTSDLTPTAGDANVLDDLDASWAISIHRS